jgi:hypothetical protein
MGTTTILLNWKAAPWTTLCLKPFLHQLLGLEVHLIELLACLAIMPGTAMEEASESTARATRHPLTGCI